MRTLERPIIRNIAAEPAHWYVSNRFTVLADRDETGNDYGLIYGLVDKSGTPPPHVHSNEDEIFYIVKGEGVALVGEQEFKLTAGDIAYLPRGIAHQPIAVSEEVEMLALITPADFIGFFREFMTPATHQGLPHFDECTFPSVESMLSAANRYQATMLPPGASISAWPMPEIHAEPKLVQAGKGETLDLFGSTVTVKLDGNDTQGLFSMFEVSDPVGAGAPPHIHRNDSEAFYVLEGEYEVTVEGITETAGPGTFIYVPRDIVRSYRNSGEVTARMLLITAQSGHENFFREVDALADFDARALYEIANRHGIEIVG
jgi:quercetin dioxygenase-like cupin family protein